MSHWLTSVVRSAGLENADMLDLPAGLADMAAWDTTCSVCGIESDQLADTVAAAFRIEVASLADAEPTATKLLPANIAKKFGVFPVRDMDRFLVVATSNPTDVLAEQEVGFACGRTPTFVVADPWAISLVIEGAYSAELATAALLSDREDDSGYVDDVLVEMTGDDVPEEISEADTAAAPVVRLANIILHEAIARGASDIHIQPNATGGVVRFRSDGVLHSGMQMPGPVLTRVVSRIKIMASLDITDRIRPQDGRARIVVAGKKYDLRVSTVPTRGAEKAVIRILDTQGMSSLDDTGIAESEIARIRGALSTRDGIFIVTGPTGSGKTTTLYGALQEISTEEVNIMTVEDPVEYELPGLTQIQVERKQGMTFASALRAILRQDPDVIFIGEIRDRETAEIAAQASLTGHLVLATLHTNDAVGSIRRFIDLGLDAATVSATLRASLAQRLVRKVCVHCAERIDGDPTSREKVLQEQFGRSGVVRAKGCDRCVNQGYFGRIPVTEFLTSTPALVSLILGGASSYELQRQAEQDGMHTLLSSALDRLSAGETTLEEVERVIGTGSSKGTQTSPVPAEAVAELEQPAEAVAELEQPADLRAEVDGAVSEATPLRIVTPEATPASAPVSAPDAPSDAPSDAQSDAPHILLVDDDGTIRSLARGLLENLDYKVSESTDGSEALVRLAKGERFSLVVLDLDMPNLGGREVLRAVRQSSATAHLPVVVLTGSQDSNADIELLEQGADDYIRKPIDPARFQLRVKAALRRAVS